MDDALSALSRFHQSFSEVDCVLNSNRNLISEINHNHETRIPEMLTRNVSLIKQLNDNILKVVNLYSQLSEAFEKSFENVGGVAGEECDDDKDEPAVTYKSSPVSSKRTRTS